MTFNLSDFPHDVLSPRGVEAVHPDDFIVGLIDADAAAVRGAVKRQREGLKNPPHTASELLDTLAQQKLPQTVARLREFIDLL